MVTESIRRQAVTCHPSHAKGWPGALTRLVLAVLLAIGAGGAAQAEGAPTKGPPGGIYIYAITRDGTPIGQQRMEFVSDGEKLRVLSRMELAVTLLGMTIFDFNQQVEEVHDGDKLLSLVSEADDDGKDRKVNLTLQGDLLKGSYNGNDRAIDPRLITSLFWKAPAVGETQLIDTLRGKVRDVTVKYLGPETLTLPVGRVETRHYQMRGEWERELWYDANGILVAGTRPGPDGTTVRLELQQRP